MADAIKVDGLKEFSRNLKRLDNDLPKALRQALNVAADLVVDKAEPLVPRRTGRAAKSLRASSTRTESRASGGNSRVAYYGWLDFGGRVGRRHSVVRKFIPDGRYLYKSYFDLKDSGKFEDTLNKALLDVVRQAGFEVT